MNKIGRNNIYLVPYVLWLLLFVIIPIMLMAYYSFFNIQGAFTFSNYFKLFESTYIRMILTSFWYAFLITLFSLLVALPAAYALKNTKHKELWLLLIILPTWINLLLKAYAFIGIFGAHGSVNQFLEFIGLESRQILFTKFSFVFVGVYIFIPFMLIPIFNSLERLDNKLFDAASDLGASSWGTFWRVIFPLTIEGVKAGVIAVFIPSISLFMLVRLIAGNRITTIGTAIEQHFLITEDWGMGAAIAIFLMFVMVVVVFLLNKNKDRRE